MNDNQVLIALKGWFLFLNEIKGSQLSLTLRRPQISRSTGEDTGSQEELNHWSARVWNLLWKDFFTGVNSADSEESQDHKY
jgi:hypothetical protein